MNNSQFIRLIKAWHPDRTRDSRKKLKCEEMTKIILRAQDEGDIATLDEIDRWGEGYLRICHERESARRKDQKMWEAYEKRMAMQEEDRCGGEWAGAYPMQSPRRNGIRRFLCYAAE